MAAIDTYKRVIDKIIINEIAKQWAANGHKLTNNLIDQTVLKIISQLSSVIIDIEMPSYGAVMNSGVPANKVPYSGRSGSGGKSLYIEGLKKYVELRMGLSGKKALGVAFAIAAKQRAVGIPIRTKGKGTKWLDKAFNNMDSKLLRATQKYIFDEVSVSFKNLSKV